MDIIYIMLTFTGTAAQSRYQCKSVKKIQDQVSNNCSKTYNNRIFSLNKLSNLYTHIQSQKLNYQCVVAKISQRGQKIASIFFSHMYI